MRFKKLVGNQVLAKFQDYIVCRVMKYQFQCLTTHFGNVSDWKKRFHTLKYLKSTIRTIIPKFPTCGEDSQRVIHQVVYNFCRRPVTMSTTGRYFNCSTKRMKLHLELRGKLNKLHPIKQKLLNTFNPSQ
jgi:hypothetical protein